MLHNMCKRSRLNEGDLDLSDDDVTTENDKRMYYESIIDLLPPEIFVEILKQMDVPTLKVSRQVCKKWKMFIDNEIPMSIVVDDRQKGNTSFAHKVIKKQVTLKHLVRTNTAAFRFPRKCQVLEKMEVRGAIHPGLMIKELYTFSSLKYLIFGGDGLLQKLNFSEKMMLPNVEVLTLNSAFKRESNLPLGESKLISGFAQNIMAFLKNFWCPTLKELIMDGDVDQYRLKKKYDWKRIVVVNFIELHRATLERVLIGESNIFQFQDDAPSYDMVKLPCNLRSLHFSFSGNQQNPSDKHIIWYDFLNSQQTMEYLNVGMLWFQYANDILQRLPVTLKHLAVYWNLSNSQSINADIFGNLINLEHLELTYDGALGHCISNLDQLQKCTKLKVFITEQLFISAMHLEDIPSYMPKLEVLYIFNCSDKLIPVVSESAPFGITHKGLSQILWSMDELEFLYLWSGDFLGDPSTIADMKELIGKISNPGISKKKLQQDFCVGREPKFKKFFSFPM